MFDLTIFTLTLDAGREQYELPGFHVASAPRRAARLHAQDQLILYYRLLNLAGVALPAAFTHSQQSEIAKRLAETYFTMPGSVTAGLRAVVTQLNEFLYNRNRKSGADGQLFGVLNLAALHGDSLILAHGGPAHAFLLGDNQPAHFSDSLSGGRGLGLAGQAAPHFYQATVEPGNLLILSSDAPAGWNAKILADGAKLPFDQLRRRLATGVAADIGAAVIRFQPGKGQVTYWRPSAAEQVPSRPTGRARPAPQAQSAAVQASAAPPEVSILPPEVQKPDSTKLPVARPAQTPPEPETPPPAAPESSPPVDAATPADPAQVINIPAPLFAPEPEEPPLQDYSEEAFLPQDPDESVDFTIEEETQAPAGLPSQKPAIFLGDSSVKEPPASPLPRPSIKDTRAAAVDSTIPSEQEESASTPVETARKKRAGAKRGLFGLKLFGGQPAPRREPAPVQKSAAQAVETVEAEPPVEPRSENLRRGLASAMRSGRKARAKVGGAAAKVLPRQPFFNLSSGVMLGIAIVIPLIVVAVALTVYLRSGYSEKFAAKMAMAQQFEAQAKQQQDPIQQRDSWKQVYVLVNEALTYEPGNQPARDLRRQALDSIDALEGFVRLDYQPLRDGLGQNVNITRMVATLTGVYLLDSNQGRVYRLQPTTSGYNVDPNFDCGPGKAGSQIITQLIDLAELPVNNQFHADIMAIDAGGSLVYCSSAAEGFDSQQLTPPDNGWGTITAITSLGDALFVMDPKGNAVYRYDGENGVFTTGPHLYFDIDVPHMADVIDLAVDQEFLYLLHDNGQMTVCDSGGVSYAKTKCTDPTPYGDTRSGYEPSPLVFTGSHFTRIQATQPPDPALYALDTKNRSIYHLSLRLLNLQRQYLPQPETDFPLPASEPTAFAVTTNRRAVMAFGNLIYFAPIP